MGDRTREMCRKEVEKLSKAAKPKPVYSSDPKRSRLERKLHKVADKIKKDQESKYGQG